MTACVIMHNMIVEDERPERLYDQGFQFQGENVVPEPEGAATFESSSNFIMTCVIGKLTCNCKMIWLSICGLMLTTNKCIFFYSFAKLYETVLFVFGL